MSKRYFLVGILLTLCGAFVAQGQENFKSTVTITKEFEGKLADVQKSKFNTSYSDTLLKFNLNFDYSVFDRPYKDLYEFTPVEGVELSERGEVIYPFLQFRGAISYPWAPEADLYIQPRLGERHALTLYGNHDSFWGNDGLKGSPVNRSKTKGGLTYGYNWSKGEARISGYYNYDYHFFNKGSNYNYGAQNTQMAGGNLLVRSLNPDKNAFYYSVDMDYGYTLAQKSAVENLIKADIDLGFRIKGNHRLNLGVNLHHSQYKTTLLMQKAGKDTSAIKGIVELAPQYAMTFPRINLVAGISFSGGYSHNNLDQSFRVYPNVQFSYEAVKSSLWLKMKIDGESRLYGVQDMLIMNPWIDVNKVESCYIPLRGEAAIQGVVGDIFGYSVSGGYVRYNEFLSFYGVDDLQRSVVAEDVNEWNVAADLVLKTDPVDCEIKAQYRSLSEGEIYMVPNLTLDGNIKYNYMGRIYAEVGAKYYSAMEGKGVSYKGFVDLRANFTYVLNSKFSFFAQGKNLLNNKIFLIQDYVEPGLNFGLGLVVKL